MKTEEEVRVFLKDKSFCSEDTRTIRAIIKAKNYNGIDVVIGGIPNSKLIDFIDWFESESKENNQDTIIFEGKEYGFVEYNIIGHIHCNLCDLRLRDRKGSCPYPCMDTEREDKKDGYFKLKNIQEQKLELIPNEFYTVKIDDVIIDTLIFEGTTQDMLCFGYSISFQGRNKNTLWTGYDENIKYARSYQLATPEEKQQLIDVVEKQEGKLWNEQTKTFEDKPNNILVPENIKIVHRRGVSFDFGILFNNDKQVLYFDFMKNVYLVSAFYKNYWDIIPCKLIETTPKELNKGDLFINRESIKGTELWDCSIYLGDNSHVFAYNEGIVTSYNINNVIYKITPID